jgi:hypothetical integral membrane protein (TIGR02206 family)
MVSHHAYRLSHLMWLTGIAGVSILVSQVCRRNLVPHIYIRAALVCLLAGGEVMRLFTDTMRWPDLLPLNLCNITSWVAVYACLMLSSEAAEFAYLVGYCCAGMALLTPDLGGDWPARFFVNHGAIIVAASAFVYGRILPLQHGSVWRTYRWFSIYIGSTFVFDMTFPPANYSYLREKPHAFTLLSLLGPWPWYIWGSGAVALVFFLLLWLPARPRSGNSLLERDVVSPVVPTVGSENFGEPESSV